MSRLLCLGVVCAFASAASGGWSGGWVTYHEVEPELSVEEERLQRFWRDYYQALRQYYDSIDHIDWVAYYKNHGQPITPPGSAELGLGVSVGRIQFAPVVVSPTMQWAVPGGLSPNVARSGPVSKEERRAKTTTVQPANGIATVSNPPSSFPIAQPEKAPCPYKAVRLSSDETECTQQLNDLAANGWHFMRTIGNGLSIFRQGPVDVPANESERR